MQYPQIIPPSHTAQNPSSETENVSSSWLRLLKGLNLQLRDLFSMQNSHPGGFLKKETTICSKGVFFKFLHFQNKHLVSFEMTAFFPSSRQVSGRASSLHRAGVRVQLHACSLGSERAATPCRRGGALGPKLRQKISCSWTWGSIFLKWRADDSLKGMLWGLN